MSEQIKIHNEVVLVGRIVNCQKNVRCNNKKAIRVRLAIPNDENYNLIPNSAYIYIYDDGMICDSLKNGRTIAINGHIESHFGQRIVANVISLIKENNMI